MVERAGVYRVAGYSWFCTVCGEYGSDWVTSATAHRGVARCKQDASDEYSLHMRVRHGAGGAGRAGTEAQDAAEASS